MPSIGEMTPPKTWYNPWNCCVFSILITLRIFSTTQMSDLSRRLSEQIWHTSVSEILWHTLQYFTSCFSVTSAFAKLSTDSFSCLSMCKTSRRAVFRPMPGRRENSPTAFSKSIDGYCCSTLLFAVSVCKNSNKYVSSA